MIIGQGTIAQLFIDFSEDQEITIFASGVSNSLCTDKHEFLREKQLLHKTLNEIKTRTKLVYFSTFNIFDPSLKDNDYVIHKLSIENELQKHNNTLIIRIPILLGKSGNKNTLINFFTDKITGKETFLIFENATRYFIDQNDLKNIISKEFILENVSKRKVNIAHPESFRITSLVNIIEEHLGIESKGTRVPKGENYQVKDIFFPLIKPEIKLYIQKSLKEQSWH